MSFSRQRKTEAAGGPPRVLLIGISRYLYSNPRALSLAVGYLKNYADAELRGKCEIRTLNLLSFNAGLALKFAAAWRPDIVAFSCYLWNSRKVEELCRRLKAKYPRTRIILGGPEATGRKADLLEKCGADALVSGEGEAAFTDLLARYAAGRDWKGTPGVMVRSGKRVHEGPARPVMPALDAIPSPFRDAAVSLGVRAGSKRFYPYETMRGCPNKCTYCVWTELGAKRLRYFSYKRIESDLRSIVKNTPSSFIFVADSDTFLNHGRAMKLAPLFHAAAGPGGCYIIFQTNLNHWREELMRAWNNANFEMNVGVNSIIPAVQKILGRSYPKSLVEEKLALMHRVAPKTRITMQLMHAAPGETFRDFCETFDWAWRQPVAYRLFFHTQPLYGTQMRENAAELGIKCRRTPPYNIVSTRECTAGEIKKESLMILFSTVWMSTARSRRMYRAVAAASCGGSLSGAFLKIWDGMAPEARAFGLRTLKRFTGGSDWFLDDFELDMMRSYVTPGAGPFIRAAHAALLAAYGGRGTKNCTAGRREAGWRDQSR
ncbi:MAG TPA: hypothetical protein DCZ92_02025 [Elusimicrobia bacterium]|nr:hypothetical protein [Elusimicrobiota bacterium]